MYEHWKQFHWPSLLTVLEQFPGVSPQASVLVAMLPLLQPRFYSLSSSPLLHPQELHLTVAVVSYRTKGGEGPEQLGVASNYLNTLPIGSLVPLFVRTASSFHLPPPSPTPTPIIMVGPGTGIAPFRGFWQERKLLQEQGGGGGIEWGRMSLFFGCRVREMILYREELEALKGEGIISDIFLALSREPQLKKVGRVVGGWGWLSMTPFFLCCRRTCRT